MRFESVGHPEPTAAQKAADLSRRFALIFQKIGLFFELLGYLQPALGNGAASSAFRKLAVPRRQFTQFVGIRRPDRPVHGQCQSPAQSRPNQPYQAGGRRQSYG